MIPFGNKLCLFGTEEGSASLDFPGRSAFQQRSREMMSRDDELWTIALVSKSGDLMLDSHSECNNLLGALFYIIFGQKPVRNSTPYVVTVGMLGYFLKKILAPGKPCVQICSCRPRSRLLPGAHAPMVDRAVEKV
jgi:hypothetical protein